MAAAGVGAMGDAQAEALLAAFSPEQQRALALLLERQQKREPATPTAFEPAWAPEIRFTSDRQKGDAVTQQWEHVLHYYPQAMWRQEEMAADMHQNDRVMAWTEKPLRMGLRHPSEETRAKLVSAFLLANPRIAANMNSIQRSAHMDIVKEAFASRVRREGRTQCLAHLPRDPAELNKHDATKHILASEDPAVPRPFPDYDVKKMRDSFKVRKDKTVNRQATLTSPDAQMQCVQMMMQAFQRMMGMSAGSAESQEGVPGPHNIYIYMYTVFSQTEFFFDVFLDVAFSTPMVSIDIDGGATPRSCDLRAQGHRKAARVQRRPDGAGRRPRSSY